jgi:trehalose 6-phosphate synthase
VARALDGRDRRVETCRREVRAELGLAPDALLGVGVDRIDYTKGIEERLRPWTSCSSGRPRSAAASRSCSSRRRAARKIERYRELDERVEAPRRAHQRALGPRGLPPPVVLRVAHHEPPTVFRYYRAAELCYVSSLHDGMNLVAKEFVAARDDEQGVLVLSQFTGAARDLTEALS